MDLKSCRRVSRWWNDVAVEALRLVHRPLVFHKDGQLTNFLCMSRKSFQRLPFSKFTFECNRQETESVREFVSRHSLDIMESTFYDDLPTRGTYSDFARILAILLNSAPNLKCLSLHQQNLIFPKSEDVVMPILFPNLHKLNVQFQYVFHESDGCDIIYEIVQRSPALTHLSISYQFSMDWIDGVTAFGNLKRVLDALTLRVKVHLSISGKNTCKLRLIKELLSHRTNFKFNSLSVGVCEISTMELIAIWASTQPHLKLWIKMQSTEVIGPVLERRNSIGLYSSHWRSFHSTHINFPSLRHLRIRASRMNCSALNHVAKLFPNLDHLFWSSTWNEWHTITGELEQKTALEIMTGQSDFQLEGNPSPFGKMNGWYLTY